MPKRKVSVYYQWMIHKLLIKPMGSEAQERRIGIRKKEVRQKWEPMDAEFQSQVRQETFGSHSRRKMSSPTK